MVNALIFPSLFRRVLDVRARRISAGMALATAESLAGAAGERGLTEASILPRCDDIEVAAQIAAAVGMAAQAEGLAQLSVSRQALYEGAVGRIQAARLENRTLVAAGLIAAVDRTSTGS
jgi:malate dehydrogenase (oxaloacetate-decarboxylating)